MDEPLDDQKRLADAFQAMLRQCLKIRTNDEVLIIFDESLGDLQRPLLDALQALSASTTFVFFPRSYQHSLVSTGAVRERIALPHGLIAAISNSTAILNMLDGDTLTASLRRTINHTNRMRTCRLATIPGITADIVMLVLESPIEEICDRCELAAWALGECADIELRSYDSRGRRYTLKVPFAGWDNEPIISSGVLMPGSWGNIPPGETFCCPDHTEITGEVCISGSVPGQIIEPGGELVLSFAEGRMTHWRPADPKQGLECLAFFEKAKLSAETNFDPNWNVFAELGIGLNTKIAKLTGNPLYDEKASQTVHIAIGDNSVFGHDIVSFHHSDLVVWHPDLLLDGEMLVSRGQLTTTAVEQRRAAFPTMEHVPLDGIVRMREARCESIDGRLFRRLTKAHRVNYVAMGSPEVGRALSTMNRIILDHETVLVRDLVNETPKCDGVATADLLGVLNHYKVLHVRLPNSIGGGPQD